VVGVEVEDDFDVGSGDFEAFVGFAFGGDGAGPVDGNGTGREFLGNEDGEGLRAAASPIVNAGEHDVLVVEIIVENGDPWRAEGIFLIEGMSALHLESSFGGAVDEGNVGAVGFIGLSDPVVRDGRAVGIENQRAGDNRGFSVGSLQRAFAFGGPGGAGGFDGEFFAANGFAVEEDVEFAFVGGEDGVGFIGGVGGEGESLRG